MWREWTIDFAMQRSPNSQTRAFRKRLLKRWQFEPAARIGKGRVWARFAAKARQRRLHECPGDRLPIVRVDHASHPARHRYPELRSDRRRAGSRRRQRAGLRLCRTLQRSQADVSDRREQREPGPTPWAGGSSRLERELERLARQPPGIVGAVMQRHLSSRISSQPELGAALDERRRPERFGAASSDLDPAARRWAHARFRPDLERRAVGALLADASAEAHARDP